MLIRLPKLFFCFLLAFVSFTVTAQEDDDYEYDEDEWLPGTYMKQATDAAFEKASLMTALSEFSFGDKLFLAGALLEMGETIALDVELSKGKAYTFIGGGDEDVLDLDLYIVDANGEVAASDTEDDGTPIPDFVPEESGIYSVRMQLVAGEQSTSFVSLAILTEGGITLEDESFNGNSSAFYGRGEQMNLLSVGGIRWHDVDNQWCLFGLLLEQGESWNLSNMRMGALQHQYYVTANKEQVTDIEVQVMTARGKLIHEQQGMDLNFTFNTEDNIPYELSIKNRSSKKGRQFILVGVVTEDF